MVSDRTERRLTAILHADVVGYSRLMAADDEATLAAIKATLAICTEAVERHRGRIVDAVGDNFLAELPSVVDAVACAVALQKTLAAHNLDIETERRMLVRVGVDLGDVIVDGERLYGDGVNIAARLQALSEPGGVVVSRAAYEQVEGRTGLAFEDLGEQPVKNIPRPIRAYAVMAADAERPAPRRKEALASGRPAIAVLPFDNLTGDPEQEYFADGLAEDLITRLCLSRWLSVIARASSFVFRGRGVDVPEAARGLGARYVVLGSVRRSGRRVRVSAQLVEAAGGVHVWADRYDRELGEVFDAQDELARAISAAIVPRLQHAEEQRALRRDPGDLDAWDASLRGAWHRHRGTREDLAEAEALLRHATELDPQLVTAWTELANCLFIEVYYGWAADPAARIEEAMQIARDAVSLDDAHPGAHYAVGWGRLFRGDHEGARASGERALELNPSMASAHWVRGVALTGLGRPEEGIAAIEEAIRLSPRDSAMRFFQQNLGIANLLAGRYEAAAECARGVLALGPEQSAPHRLLAACHGHLGRSDAAREAFRTAVELEPGFSLDELRRINHPTIVDALLDGWRKAGIDPDRPDPT